MFHTRPPQPSAHAAFRNAVDPFSARQQMRMSVGVIVVLMAAIWLCASAVTPRSGWVEPTAVALSRNGTVVNAWLSGPANQGG